MFQVFGSQKDDLWPFEEQLARWKTDKLSVGQRHEVDRLTEQVGRCRTVIDSILSLAEQLKQGTIEKVLAKSDLELGLEFLLSKGNLRIRLIWKSLKQVFDRWVSTANGL